MEALQVTAVHSPQDESNAALTHPHGHASPAVYAYATKQGRVRLLEVVSRRTAADAADVLRPTLALPLAGVIGQTVRATR